MTLRATLRRIHGNTALTLGGPSRTITYDYVPAASVLHFRYAVDPFYAMARQRAGPGGGAGWKAFGRDGSDVGRRVQRASR